MEKNKIEIWYLYHSGFAVKTPEHFLIFDYYCGPGNNFTGERKEGLINPFELKEESVIVFSSHAHADHYDKRILDWRNEIPDITYILSDDIKQLSDYTQGNILPVHFNRNYEQNGICIRTLHSTDAGVAFLVTVDGYTIYHAGDLNWWHWNGESKHYNDSMAGEYRHEIDSLTNTKIDFAFVPLDPRLEDKYLLGIDYFAKKTNAETIFPMHFGDDYSVFTSLNHDKRTDSYRHRIVSVSHKGQYFDFNR